MALLGTEANGGLRSRRNNPLRLICAQQDAGLSGVLGSVGSITSACSDSAEHQNRAFVPGFPSSCSVFLYPAAALDSAVLIQTRLLARQEKELYTVVLIYLLLQVMASVGHLGIIVLIYAVISGQIVPSIGEPSGIKSTSFPQRLHV